MPLAAALGPQAWAQSSPIFTILSITLLRLMLLMLLANGLGSRKKNFTDLQVTPARSIKGTNLLIRGGRGLVTMGKDFRGVGWKYGRNFPQP